MTAEFPWRLVWMCAVIIASPTAGFTQPAPALRVTRDLRIDAVVLGVSAKGLYKQTAELKRNMDDPSVFVAAQIKDNPLAAHEIHRVAEVPFDLGWT